MHAHNRGATLQDRAPQTEKMLSRKPFGRSKELQRREGNTDDLVRNLDSLDVKAGENPKNFGHHLAFAFVSQPMVFGRRMITKAKRRKGEDAKRQKGKKQKSQKPKKREKMKDD